MSSAFHKKHSVVILSNLFAGLPPTPRGWSSQAQETVLHLLADPQPLFPVTALLTHFIFLNCFLISWGQHCCHSVFRALCVSKCLTRSLYFIVHLDWKGSFASEGEHRFLWVNEGTHTESLLHYFDMGDLGEVVYPFWAWDSRVS